MSIITHSSLQEMLRYHTTWQGAKFLDPFKIEGGVETYGGKEIKRRKGFFFETSEALHFTASYQDVKALATGPNFMLEKNYTKASEIVYGNDPDKVEFSGGTYEQSMDIGDVGYFNTFRDEIEKKNIQRDIVPEFLLNRKRKRSKSESDGDYSHDEKWNLKPYSHARRDRLPQPSLRLAADFSINCMYEAEHINRFGALVWSITQLLESIGINVEVVIKKRVKHIHYDNSKGPTDFIPTVLIKHTNEYLSPIAMTTCFRSVFYRRCIFNLTILAADMVGAEVCSGLGQSNAFTDTVAFHEGELILGINSVKNLDLVKQEISKIFSTKKGV